jgi:diguanylate cyclase (GGDEF)-like protein
MKVAVGPANQNWMRMRPVGDLDQSAGNRQVERDRAAWRPGRSSGTHVKADKGLMDTRRALRWESNRRLMAYSAAVMYGGATLIDAVEAAIPGGQTFSLVPGIGALVLVALLVAVGPRLPLPVMVALGPLGVAGIALALSTTSGTTDGAILYSWPVLWEAYFFGRRGTILIIVCVGIAHALALVAMADGAGNLDRWIDVMASVTVIGTVVEILASRNRMLVERISGEARVDELTGLLNRRGFDERARTELAWAQRERTSLAVVCFDLDFFKSVNDEFGHEMGDLVLARLAECFRREARQIDVVARMGGEEFVALLPGAGLDAARGFAERVRLALHGSAPAGAPRVTVSAGAASAVAPERVEQLLKAADMALYAAKAQGRDRTVLDRPATVADGGSPAG